MALDLDYEGLCIGWGHKKGKGSVIIKSSSETWAMSPASAKDFAIQILLQVDMLEKLPGRIREGEEDAES